MFKETSPILDFPMRHVRNIIFCTYFTNVSITTLIILMYLFYYASILSYVLCCKVNLINYSLPLTCIINYNVIQFTYHNAQVLPKNN